MDEINVNDEWVRVSSGYINAEEEYTRELTTEWYIKVYRGEIDEDLREKILNKRAEFYQLYKQGKLTIKPPQKTPRWKTLWEKIIG